MSVVNLATLNASAVVIEDEPSQIINMVDDSNGPHSVQPQAIAVDSADSGVTSSPKPTQTQDLLGNVSPAMSVSSPSDEQAGGASRAADISDLSLNRYRTGYVYDTRMMLHANPSDNDHPEKPVRIYRIFQRLKEAKVLERMKRIAIREVTQDEVSLVHDLGIWTGLEQSALLDPDYIKLNVPKLELHSSLYINEHSAFAARLSCGGAIELCDAIASGHIRNGFAIIRPPGHHAEPHKSMGFCFYNNVAVATRFLQQKYPDGSNAVRKVLILDWDVHHGNGTQRAFENDPDVLYISLHRYDGATFYPGSRYANYDSVGQGAGQGKSVNIPWPGPGMRDADYLYAFLHLVMPIAQEFAPDFVIISAGFDAALGDPIGETCVTPAGYAHMTHALASLCEGRLAVILEGGYNPDAIAESALAVTQTILSEPPPPLRDSVASIIAARLVQQVCRIQSQYWKSIQVPEIERVDVDTEPDAELSDSSSAPTVAKAKGTPVVHWAELMAAYRRDVICSKYDLFDIPLTMEPHRAFQGHVLCSQGILQDFDTIVFFIHDMGNLRYETKPNPYGAQDESVKLVDASSRVVDYVRERHYGLVDMNILAQFKTRYIPPMMNYTEALHEAKATALFLWDNVVALDRDRVRNVVLIGFGSGCECVTHILQHRSSQDVRAVVQVVGHGPMPRLPVEVDLTLKKWYNNKSKVILPADHIHALRTADDTSNPKKRFGRIQLSTQLRTINILNHHMKDLQAFIDKKMQAVRAASSDAQ